MGVLEREEFLARLGDRLGDAGQGHGSLVVICGEAGVGKTALVDSFCAGVRDRVRLLWGVCDPVTPPRPFAPLVDIGDLVGGPLRQALRDGDRHAAYNEFLTLLRGPGPPRVVVFEDMHWADEATLDLLRVVGCRLHTIRTLFVVTYRDDDVGVEHPLRLALGDVPTSTVSTIQLPPLSLEAVKRLVGPAGLDPVSLHQLTGGNPFFVTEVIAAGAAQLPATVRDAVRTRASRLSPAAQHVLQVASLLGQPCEASLLRTVAGGGDRTIEECTARGMLTRDGELLRFRHELARRAVWESLAPSVRAGLHDRVLRVLSSRPGTVDPGELARHAVEAGNGIVVLNTAPVAARRASALGAHRAAAAHYGSALRFAADLDVAARADLLDAHAGECLLTDDVTSAIASREQALACWQELGDVRRQGDSMQALAYLWWYAGHWPRARQIALAAVALLEPLRATPELARACARVAQLSMVHGHDNGDVIAWGRRALALAELLDEESLVVHVLNSIGVAESCMGRNVECALLIESLERARAARLQEDISRAFVNLIEEKRDHREFDLADRYLTEAISYATDHDLDLYRRWLLMSEAGIALERGFWDESVRHARAALAGVSPNNPVRAKALTFLGRVRVRRGDPDASSLFDEALELAGSDGDLASICPLRAARAEAAWLAGDTAGAAMEANAGLELPVHQANPWWRGELAFWSWKSGALVERPPGCADPYVFHMDGEFRRAAAAWAGRGCPYQQAGALADSDDEADLREALELFHSLGARPAAAIVARRLREAGIRSVPRGPRDATRGNPAGLTARELEVLTLLGQGLRNVDIAQRLVVSPKTIEHHVSAILAKLGVHSRAAAARHADQLGFKHGGPKPAT